MTRKPVLIARLPRSVTQRQPPSPSVSDKRAEDVGREQEEGRVMERHMGRSRWLRRGWILQEWNIWRIGNFIPEETMLHVQRIIYFLIYIQNSVSFLWFLFLLPTFINEACDKMKLAVWAVYLPLEDFSHHSEQYIKTLKRRCRWIALKQINADLRIRHETSTSSFQSQNNRLPAEANRKCVVSADKRTLEYLETVIQHTWSCYCFTRRCWLIY